MCWINWNAWVWIRTNNAQKRKKQMCILDDNGDGDSDSDFLLKRTGLLCDGDDAVSLGG